MPVLLKDPEAMPVNEQTLERVWLALAHLLPPGTDFVLLLANGRESICMSALDGELVRAMLIDALNGKVGARDPDGTIDTERMRSS